MTQKIAALFRLLGQYCSIYQFSPCSASILLILSIITGMVAPLHILFLQQFIDKLIAIVKKSAELEAIIEPVAGIALIYIYLAVEGFVSNLCNLWLKHRLQLKIDTSVINHLSKIHYWYIEDKDTQNLIERVCANPHSYYETLFTNINRCIIGVISVTGVVLILLQAGKLIGLGIMLLSIPVIIISMNCGKNMYAAYKMYSEDRRRYYYLEDVMFRREYALERRLFSYLDYIYNQWKNTYSKVITNIEKGRLKAFLQTSSGTIAVDGFVFISALALTRQLFVGLITIGFFLSVIRALYDFNDMVINQLSEPIRKIGETRGGLLDLNRFYSLNTIELSVNKDYVSQERRERFTALTVKDLWFKYPNTDEFILKGLNMRLESGKHYAMVGVNGAGKSTLIKLLLGLYTANSGLVLYNDRDVSAMTSEELTSYYAVIFQDYAKYCLVLQENIGIGNLKEIHNDGKILKVIRQAGLDSFLNGLPAGLQTPIGKVLDSGYDLSEGEWQRLAFARAMMRQDALLVLDEPTSALDPIAESQLYNRFADLLSGRSALFISHRLASTKLAHEILVLDDGVITEQGTHQSLMEMGGLYARMYESQKKWYRVES